MSLTLTCAYIVIGVCFLLFLNYKFVKLFMKTPNKYSPDANSNSANVSNKNETTTQTSINGDGHGEKSPDEVWSIPGPLKIPLLGTKWIYLWKYKMSKIHEVYKDFNRKYGPIVLEVTSNWIPIVVLYDRVDIEKVLRIPSKYPFRPPTEIVAFYRKKRPDRYASTGITNEQGEIWHNLRTKLTPQITSPRVLQAFLPALNEICDDFIELLRTKRNASNVVENFQDVANLFGLEAACTLMLGRRMGFLSVNPPENVAKLASAVKMLFITQRDSSYGFSLWKYVPTKTYRDFVQTEETIYNIISEIVDTTLNENELDSYVDENSMNSVFYSILSAKDLDIRDKKSAIIDFISAGIETLANTLIFILHYVTTSREDILQSITNEFEHCGQMIDTNDLAQANYTKACLQETYRICPTAFCLARILQEDTCLSGYNVKSGTVVLCQNMVSCHDADNFRNPDEFVPERWLTDNSKTNSRCSEAGANLVVPFGVGKRQCPGRRFVEMELILLIAKMARAFDIRFCDKLEMEFEFLLTPKTPINLFLRERLS